MTTRAQHLAKIAVDCRECARVYTESPGLAGPGANAGTISDIYLTIARVVDDLVESALSQDEHAND